MKNDILVQHLSNSSRVDTGFLLHYASAVQVVA
jgi:hypothetical protein